MRRAKHTIAHQRYDIRSHYGFGLAWESPTRCANHERSTELFVI